MDLIDFDYKVKIRYEMEIENEEEPPWFEKVHETEFILGRDSIPEEVERVLKGKKTGDRVEVVLPPESAFGPHLPYLVKEMELSLFKEVETLKPGKWHEEVLNPYGSKLRFKILEISGDKVKVDFNHPGAGKRVKLKIEILSHRPATPFEIFSAEMRNCSGG
ncbi:MAG: FKBP-type peptidyl-prolyl cis-trans isomerase [Thermodesulfobacteriaceae bacterium]|nr:FKBP-type peptidyl-prolyl cis-trans isomerase [Thermodesulfobacteriaceae bacterium]MCX8041534.1 FKBP-type peptidyl-prolyl cis-trans isomerase [Thermodesulfobacteriaceae bacterium]MDW8135983.1 FKBP-type peptidyl-prolyl cis-trans isomerase [Thermodesulfobacterium sp.]